MALIRAAAPHNAFALNDFGSRWLSRARRGRNRARTAQDCALLALRPLTTGITSSNAARIAGAQQRMESVTPLILKAASLVDAIDDTPAYELGSSARDVFRAEFEFA